METLAQREDRRLAERGKEAENSNAARMGRAVGSGLVSDRVYDAVMHLTPAGVEPRAQPRKEPEIGQRVRDPERHEMRPPGYSVGMGPSSSAGMAGTTTSRQAFLNQRHEQQQQAQAIEDQLFGRTAPQQETQMFRDHNREATDARQGMTSLAERVRTEGFMSKSHAEQSHALDSRETAAREARTPGIEDRPSIGKRLIETVMLNKDHADRSRDDSDRGR
jgi:hypothetical protein